MLPGTKLSTLNGQLLLSTGLNDFDQIIGGGLAIGSILFIEQDIHSKHYTTLSKYFIAEGIINKHGNLIISGDINKLEFEQSLPDLVDEDEMRNRLEEDKKSQGDQGLKIAWRYQESLIDKTKEKEKIQQLIPKIKYCHSFDLSKNIRQEYLDINPIEFINIKELQENSDTSVYLQLYNKISQIVNAFNKTALESKEVDHKVLRIVIDSMASPFWNTDSTSDCSLLTFMHALKGLVRNSLAVCIILFPSHIHNSLLTKKLQHLADIAVSLNSFKGEDRPEQFSEYTGLFFIKKLARINTMVSYLPETLVYGFARKRRKLYIEVLNLPPETSRSSNTKQTQTEGMMCVSGKQTNPLEF